MPVPAEREKCHITSVKLVKGDPFANLLPWHLQQSSLHVSQKYLPS